MSPVITGGPRPLATVVSGAVGGAPLPVETVVAGEALRSVLLDAGVTTPPAGTPVPALIFQKGS